MAFTVQNDEGNVAGANAYIDVDYFTTYHTDRNHSLKDSSGVDYTEVAIKAAIVEATSYTDQRFRYRGEKYNHSAQTTEFPRFDAWDFDDNAILGIPQAVKEATAEYALRALSLGTLNPDIQRGDMGMPVVSISQTLGPMTKSVTYDTKLGTRMPEYPAADAKLKRAGCVRQSNTRTMRRG